MPERWRRRAVVALLVVVTLAGAGGCGVSSSGAPADLGDGLSVGGGLGNDDTKELPDGPNLAGSPERLVQLFLWAAAGGDNGAPNRVRDFLTTNARKTWREPQSQAQTLPLTVIRIVGKPETGAPAADRRPVTITYQVVGTLNDQGVVTDLGDPSVTRTLTFWVVVPDKETSLRIDQIEGDLPSDLMLSDDALTVYYRPQPVYFWDASNSQLIPDVRYVPITIGPDQRAQRVVQWLLDGPSLWLQGTKFAQPVPSGTSIKDGVTKTQSGAWVINLAATGGIDPDAVRRLYYQLQWSLRVVTTPSIDLKVEGQLQPAPAADEYLRLNQSYALGLINQQSYDIVDGRVVTAPADSNNQPNVLTAAKADNQNVVYAAINRGGDALALVRTDAANKRYLQIVRAPDVRVDAKLPHRAEMGRPAWIPGTNLVLVPSGGQLYLVQPNGDAAPITPPSMVGVMKSISVAPDGRRIAWVAGGNAFVAPLWQDGPNIGIGAALPVLPQQLQAQAIAWTGEAWLYVVGSVGGSGAMWRTTVDGAVAEDLKDYLKGPKPTDVVATATNSPTNAGEVLLFAQGQWYSFGGTLLSGATNGGNAIKNPFFVG